MIATTAEAAWQELQNSANVVSVVISDAAKPGSFDGIDLLDRIVALGKRPISVVMMSGYDVGSQSVKHGAYDFIAKPLVKDVLLQKIDMLVQHRKSEQHVESDRKTKASMRRAIGDLSERALHTPVQVVIESIAAVLERADMTPELRADIEALRKLIVQNSNLYRPVVEHPDLDPVTRSLLLTELSLSVPESESAQTFPSIHPDDPVVYDLTQWTFNVFKHAEEGLLPLVKHMFVHLDLLGHFDIRPDVLEHFLVTVEQMYKTNSYHNWIHAVDVTQATFCFLVHFGASATLTHLDCLALMVASLCHDLGHPGVNNAHMVLTQSELAVLYNDRAVLENFHAASLFQLLSGREDVNIFASLTKKQQRDVRKSIMDCILATDMADHYEYVTKLAIKVGSGSTDWDGSDANERALLMKCIIKMADINNVARPWDISVKWACRLSEEFFAQGDKERTLGFEVASAISRSKCHQHRHEQHQLYRLSGASVF